MILRLVYSFFFITLVTGEQRLDETPKTARMGDCQNKICICQDQLDVNAGFPHAKLLKTTHTQVLQNTQPPLKVVEGHYGYPAHGLISANPVHSTNPQSRIETQSFDVEFVSDESPSLQVPRPVQYVEKETEYMEKTICFTPSMVHKMIKAALEYVSQMPSDINNIVENLDQELNRMSDSEIKEENAVRKPLYPLDSKTIFQMLDKPRSEARTNLILKYELPSVKEPLCREALEKLIEIAYTAYLELEEHPQCREYLYNFAAHQPEDRPTGQLNPGPDLNSLIASILDQVDKRKPNLDISPQHDRYGDMPNAHDIPTPQYNIPQIQEYNTPQTPPTLEYNVPQKPQTLEYNIQQKPQNYIQKKFPKYSVPEIPEYNLPQVQELNINEYNVPQAPELFKPELNLPNIHEFNINEYNVPKVHDYSITQTHEYNVPQINEYSVTQSNEYNVPKLHEYSITQSHEYNIPQIQDIIIPHIQSIEMPEIHEIHETIEEIIPMQPEETINVLIKLLQNSDQFDNGNLFHRLMNILEENKNNFHPRIFKILLTLLNVHMQNNIPNFIDIFLLLLDSQRNRDWPWSEGVTEHLLSYLIPDQNGFLDPRIVEIILNLYKKRPNEQEIEHILSLLRPFKEENVDPNIGDLILKLIHLHQHNLMRPDHVDILLKLLKINQNHINPVYVDIIGDLSRWDEMGIRPNELNGLIALLKPFLDGHPDRRLIQIVHFLLTKGFYLDSKEFILSFLYPENGVFDVRRIDIIDFIIKNWSQKNIEIILDLLQENGPAVLNSRFLEILLFLNSHNLLTPELLETIINLLVNEVTGQLEDNHVKKLFFQLAPFKQSNPKLVVDILTLLNQGGMHGNIVEWFESTIDSIIGLPNRDSKPNNAKLVEIKQDNKNEYRTPDGGYQTLDTQQVPDQDFISIFKWLESQGLITQDQGSNTDMVNKVLKILEVGQRELGVVELTYMLKHEKPLIYQPVYYVKYRLPILSFISNMKNLLLENPNLNTDPMKLLQELIVVSNVTEVSPNLQGYPKEEILKLTFNDGDLVQAKILDEQNLSLNEQITYVHGLNSDISPEEILQLNKMNEAKYFPNLLEVKGRHPDTLTIRDVDKFIDVPPVHYRHLEVPAVSHQTKTIHTHDETYIARDNPDQDALHNNNAQLRSQE